MNTTELLELAAMAAEGQKGERGPAGVGIREINQSSPTSFTIVLENGQTKEINVPAPIKGDQGEAGQPGPVGDPGVSGSPGKPGVDGAPGAPGTPGNDGSFVDTAIVNSSGDLLLSLSTGLVINCGPVVGPAGEAGLRGVQGPNGSDGIDGAAVLSGPRSPQSDDGKDGDHWIDLSSTTYSFFKKASGTWAKLAELRTQQLGRNAQQGAAVGGAAGGGSGGAPSVHPAIIDIAPPTVNNDKKPLRAGDLWFDSDQLALYVATKDSSNKIVWVICIPGVTGVPGTQAASVPVIWPVAVDGEEWVNPLTHVTYVFNEPKKQWINVNGGIVSVQDKPPLTPQTGSLWYDTEADELTLYIYTGSEWVPAAPPVSLDGINATIDAALIVQNDLLARVQAGEAEQRQIELDLEELQVTKGSVSRYKVKAVEFSGIASRNGELVVDNPDCSLVTTISFALFDINGQPTRPCELGDIIEFVEAISTASIGEVTRYRITNADSGAQGLSVEYLSGTNDFEVDETEEVYIYPQNQETASKEYVDAQDDLRLIKAGDEMTGKLTVKPTSGAFGLVVLPGPDASGTTDIFRVRDYEDKQVFYADVSGGVGVNTSWTPTSNNHLVPKKYLEDYVDTHGGGDAKVPVQPGAPGGMVVGSMWFDTTTNSLMIKVS